MSTSSSGASSFSLRLDLMDRQVNDSEDRPVGRVDEVVMNLAEDGTLSVTAMRAGQAALGPRLGGWLGRQMVTSAERLTRSGQEPSPPIPVSWVQEWSPLVTLDRPLRDLPGVAGLEAWLGMHLVSRLPGGGDARV